MLSRHYLPLRQLPAQALSRYTPMPDVSGGLFRLPPLRRYAIFLLLTLLMPSAGMMLPLAATLRFLRFLRLIIFRDIATCRYAQADAPDAMFDLATLPFD